MDTQKPEIVALFGILLGWALSTLTATIKFRNERRTDLSIAVSWLLPELSKVEILRNATEGFKDTRENWESYENTRIGLWERHGQFFQDDDNIDWNDITNRIAKHKPILAIKVRSLIHLARKLSSTDLRISARSSTAGYLKLLSIIEVAHSGLVGELQKTIRRLRLRTH